MNHEKLRHHILAHWAFFDEQQVRDKGVPPGTSVLTLRVGPEHLAPAFQFGEHDKPRPEIRELLALLPTDPTGWQQAYWLAQPLSVIPDHAPEAHASEGVVLAESQALPTLADRFTEHPDEVVAYARSVFEPPLMVQG